ncbi:MAG: pentapeptide repeat-containing protein [Thiolinea sp.]
MPVSIARFIGALMIITPVMVWGDKLNVPNFDASKDVSMRNFEGNNLAKSDFSGSNASGSSFINASLNYANLNLANFQNTNLTNVTFRLALIEYTDFTGAEGLTAAQLAEACLPRALEEEKLGVEDFDPKAYVLPDECNIWEHIPRG